MSNIVEVDGLVKRYGRSTVVDQISFDVAEGEIFGVIGPNGAGKTTTIECVEGLRPIDGGQVRTLGLDPAVDNRRLREKVGVQLQESSLPPRIKVREALELFAAFYERSRAPSDLLERLGLLDKSESSFATLSGGQKQRLFIALALVNDPRLVFLDELTTGLDPHARRAMWELVLEVRRSGKTIVLTTHFMEEAERLCDRVAILDSGRLVALDSPAALIRSLAGGRRLAVSIAGELDHDLLVRSLCRVEGVQRVERCGDRLTLDLLPEGSTDDLNDRLLDHLRRAGARVRDLREESATLEDVFLALTARSVGEELDS